MDGRELLAYQEIVRRDAGGRADPPLRGGAGGHEPARPMPAAPDFIKRVRVVGRVDPRRRTTWCWGPRRGRCWPAGRTSRVQDVQAVADARAAAPHRHQLPGRVGRASSAEEIVRRLLETVPTPKSGL